VTSSIIPSLKILYPYMGPPTRPGPQVPHHLNPALTRPFCWFALHHFAKQSYCEGITSALYREPKALRLMCQYRNRFYSNADHTRRIRKGCNVTKSDACAQKTHRTHPVCIQLWSIFVNIYRRFEIQNVTNLNMCHAPGDFQVQTSATFMHAYFGQ